MTVENRSSGLLPVRSDGRLWIRALKEMRELRGQGGVSGQSKLRVVLYERLSVPDITRRSKRTQIANVPCRRSTLAASGHIRPQSNQCPACAIPYHTSSYHRTTPTPTPETRHTSDHHIHTPIPQKRQLLRARLDVPNPTVRIAQRTTRSVDHPRARIGTHDVFERRQFDGRLACARPSPSSYVIQRSRTCPTSKIDGRVPTAPAGTRTVKAKDVVKERAGIGRSGCGVGEGVERRFAKRCHELLLSRVCVQGAKRPHGPPNQSPSRFDPIAIVVANKVIGGRRIPLDPLAFSSSICVATHRRL